MRVLSKYNPCLWNCVAPQTCGKRNGCQLGIPPLAVLNWTRYHVHRLIRLQRGSSEVIDPYPHRLGEGVRNSELQNSRQLAFAEQQWCYWIQTGPGKRGT